MTTEDRAVLRQIVDALADLAGSVADLAMATTQFQEGNSSDAWQRIRSLAERMQGFTGTARELVKALQDE